MVKSQECSSQLKQTKKYQKIDRDQRKIVLELLIKEKLSLQEVANRLHLKYCTVRTIQKAFEQDGRIGKKETRKKKLKVQSIVKVSVLNPFTLQVQPLCVQSDTTQIYVDKQPSLMDQLNLANEQKQLISSQYQQLTQALTSEIKNASIVQQSLLQNLLLSSQIVFKQILDFKPQIQVKKEFDSVSTTPYPFQQISQYPQFYPVPHSFLRT
ncbi:unnamed protein product [Paramecium primaurelia]|uniref:Helix-turn-helix domain-containing protein n=2 Tax=Paramecium TaxID=5884 RepID=A0A8S1YFR1_9CILI|nr:unnamed protein product [Paramecium primaurelia]CAD8212148.1 unnamed protein product [Paramecium pentaurelia]